MSCSSSRVKIFVVLSAMIVVVLWELVSEIRLPIRSELARVGVPGDLFYNYYVPPVGPGSVGAQMYLCPRPTPPLVGHTYVTYQPLMPHEFLYKHKRAYTTIRPDGSRSHTCVHWW